MEEDCWLSILDYIDISNEFQTAQHLCKEHEQAIECRKAREIDLLLSKSHLNALMACKK